MNPHFHAFAEMLSPHIIAVALCGARLLPISFLCPVIGGQSIPTTTRLALVLALAMSLHLAGGVSPAVPVETSWTLIGIVLKELTLGMTMGLVAALPFDAARMGGRFIDLFRGTSAEAALPMAGTHESATGHGLYEMTVALVATSGAMPIVLSALWRSFGIVKLGAFVPTEGVAFQVTGLAGSALATGLAVGAPVAAASLAVDCGLALATRAAPQMRLQDISAPLRILGGGAILWLSLGLICERLMASVVATDGALHAVLQMPR